MPKTSPDGHGSHHRRPAMLRALAVKLALVAGIVALAVLAGGRIPAGAAVVAVHVAALGAILAVLAWGGRGGGALHRGVTAGTILRDAGRYDLFMRLMTFGREGRFRRQLLAPAALRPGQRVLDVGCGTGSLAILARRLVGDAGSVTGLDASEEMIARARRKAERAGLSIGFVQGMAEALPFGAAQFDVVVGTLMLHHLAKRARPDFVSEARRVLAPSGRLVLVDFGRSGGKPRAGGLHRHGHVDMASIHALLAAGGFAVTEAGSLGLKGLEYVVAVPQRGAGAA